MDYNRIKLVINTIKYLHYKQVLYRIYYMLRSRTYKHPKRTEKNYEIYELTWDTTIYNRESYEETHKFNFLNITYDFGKTIDWNFANFGKLWTYNLNYFDFLNQKSITKQTGVSLIKSFIRCENKLVDGLEPYPISLRLINWIKFIGANRVNDNEINNSLNWYTSILKKNLEFHIMGNHLLENAFALFFSSYYFKDKHLFNKTTTLLRFELSKQILEDGAHFEQSPMYHQILLYRLLDTIQLIQLNNWNHNEELDFLEVKASKMCSWLENITFSNGQIPYVNDSSSGIAPSTEELLNYAKKLDVMNTAIQLGISGYRLYRREQYELFVDVANVMASYQPGHLHSDALQVLLTRNDTSILVDTGISTYNKNKRRDFERSSKAHNTIIIDDWNIDQIWAGFRVGERSKVSIFNETKYSIEGVLTHFSGTMISREIDSQKDQVSILDKVPEGIKAKVLFHFHPNCNVIKNAENVILEKDSNTLFNFESKLFSTTLAPYLFADGYNDLREGVCLEVTFVEYLQTTIML